MTFAQILLFVAGLAALILGAEILVRGASRLAAALRISPLVIGLTVVAFGTSAPELAVSLRSSLAGQTDLAVGNVVGSNIFNVLFILGLAALVSPLSVDRKLVRLDVPVMVAVSVVAWVLGTDGALSRAEGLMLFAAMIAYLAFLFVESRREGALVAAEGSEGGGSGSLAAAALLAVAGLGLLVVGSRWLVDGAIVLARTLGVGERVIGLTVVAAGTSLPEVATSVLASIRGQRDIAVGNVVGSNLFNLLAVLGLAAAVSPRGVEVPAGALRLDLPVMVAVAVACLPIFLSRFEIDRLEGGLFLLAWIGYTALLYRGGAVSTTLVVAVFLAPVTALTAWQLLREPRPDRA